MKLKTVYLLFLQILHAKFGKVLKNIGPVVPEKRCELTTDDDGRQPKAKGHLSDSQLTKNDNTLYKRAWQSPE